MKKILITLIVMLGISPALMAASFPDSVPTTRAAAKTYAIQHAASARMQASSAGLISDVGGQSWVAVDLTASPDEDGLDLVSRLSDAKLPAFSLASARDYVNFYGMLRNASGWTLMTAEKNAQLKRVMSTWFPDWVAGAPAFELASEFPIEVGPGLREVRITIVDENGTQTLRYLEVINGKMFLLNKGFFDRKGFITLVIEEKGRRETRSYDLSNGKSAEFPARYASNVPTMIKNTLKLTNPDQIAFNVEERFDMVIRADFTEVKNNIRVDAESWNSNSPRIHATKLYLISPGREKPVPFDLGELGIKISFAPGRYYIFFGWPDGVTEPNDFPPNDGGGKGPPPEVVTEP